MRYDRDYEHKRRAGNATLRGAEDYAIWAFGRWLLAYVASITLFLGTCWIIAVIISLLRPFFVH